MSSSRWRSRASGLRGRVRTAGRRLPRDAAREIPTHRHGSPEGPWRRPVSGKRRRCGTSGPPERPVHVPAAYRQDLHGVLWGRYRGRRRQRLRAPLHRAGPHAVRTALRGRVPCREGKG